MTFIPCFLFVFMGAPYMERLRENHRLSAMLSGISAAVVGVIVHLALWFAMSYLFSSNSAIAVGPIRFNLPDPGSFQVIAGFLTGLCLFVYFFFKKNIFLSLLTGMIFSLAFSFFNPQSL